MTEIPITAEYTFDETYGDSAGQTVVGDVVQIGKTYADVKWRGTDRTERIRLARPDGVIFKNGA